LARRFEWHILLEQSSPRFISLLRCDDRIGLRVKAGLLLPTEEEARQTHFAHFHILLVQFIHFCARSSLPNHRFPMAYDSPSQHEAISLCFTRFACHSAELHENMGLVSMAKCHCQQPRMRCLINFP
jgi:hypothetical protein